jgi:hypothetical protein
MLPVVFFMLSIFNLVIGILYLNESYFVVTALSFIAAICFAVAATYAVAANKDKLGSQRPQTPAKKAGVCG